MRSNGIEAGIESAPFPGRLKVLGLMPVVVARAGRAAEAPASR
jgi:hypothetical protein